MNRKKISFDADGVLAEGGYTPPEERSNKTYFKKNVISTDVVPSVHWLSIMYDIYVISTRQHENANLGLRAWLHFAFGLTDDFSTFAGVVTHPDELDPTTPDHPMDKAQIIRDLGISIHFDDDPRHVEALGERGILVPSDMPISVAMAGELPTLRNWVEIREFLTTPGMVIYGRNGVAVKSPAVEEKEYPKVDLEKGVPIN